MSDSHTYHDMSDSHTYLDMSDRKGGMQGDGCEERRLKGRGEASDHNEGNDKYDTT